MMQSSMTAGWRPVMWSALAALLLLPAVAMPFTREMNWGPGDFAAAAVLLGGLGLAVEGAMRLIRAPRLRIAAIVASALAVATIWADAAVGLA